MSLTLCASKVKNSKYGMVGYRPTGFYGSAFDEIKVRKCLGIETVYYGLTALFDDMKKVSEIDVKEDVGRVKRLGKICDATEESLRNGSKIYLALKDFILKEKIDFLGVRCWPEMMKRGVNPCLVLGRLIDEGVMAACESDFGGALSMAMVHWISESAVWLADLIDMDKKNNSFYIWHCGAAPRSLVHGKELPVINKQFRGGDRGNTLEFILKEGDVTVLRFGITNDNYRIFTFEGKGVFPSVRIRGNMSEIIPDAEPERVLDRIVEYGVEHHLAVVYGRHGAALRELSGLLGIDYYSADLR